MGKGKEPTCPMCRATMPAARYEHYNADGSYRKDTYVLSGRIFAITVEVVSAPLQDESESGSEYGGSSEDSDLEESPKEC